MVLKDRLHSPACHGVAESPPSRLSGRLSGVDDLFFGPDSFFRRLAQANPKGLLDGLGERHEIRIKMKMMPPLKRCATPFSLSISQSMDAESDRRTA
jgi:hypothetical protein